MNGPEKVLPGVYFIWYTHDWWNLSLCSEGNGESWLRRWCSFNKHILTSGSASNNDSWKQAKVPPTRRPCFLLLVGRSKCSPVMYETNVVPKSKYAHEHAITGWKWGIYYLKDKIKKCHNMSCLSHSAKDMEKSMPRVEQQDAGNTWPWPTWRSAGGVLTWPLCDLCYMPPPPGGSSPAARWAVFWLVPNPQYSTLSATLTFRAVHVLI